MKFTLEEIILIGIFAALTAVLAQISIPVPFSPVPITMQVFAVCFSAILLGSKCGAFSQLIYILVGVCGIPVFAGFKSGLGIILGPTGGFILSFPIMAFVMGFILEHKKQPSTMDLLGTMLIGLVICYGVGTPWLAAVLKLNAAKAVSAGVAPFLPLDILKIVTAALLAHPIRSALLRSNLMTGKNLKD